MDGEVWESTRQTAIKAIRRERNYILELECYTRLSRDNVSRISGFSVPRLVGSDDRLQVIEIKIVTPPNILDFGKVHFDRRPDYSPETWQEWLDERRELFGDHWPRVEALMAALSSGYGIYYMDPKPGNIMFGDEQRRD